jgi:hypothetical protein
VRDVVVMKKKWRKNWRRHDEEFADFKKRFDESS